MNVPIPLNFAPENGYKIMAVLIQELTRAGRGDPGTSAATPLMSVGAWNPDTTPHVRGDHSAEHCQDTYLCNRTTAERLSGALRCGGDVPKRD